MEIRRVCVFCGSSSGDDPAYDAAARATGEELAKRGIGLVFGGGKVGLMGAIADACLEAGGEVTGVIPAFLDRREIGHTDVTDLRVVETMHDRKALMAELSDGFLALPGGIGTFEELFESMTWTQLGLQRKPVGLVDVAGFWAPVRALLDGAVTHGFLDDAMREAVDIGPDAATVLDRWAAWEAPALGKWADQDSTLHAPTDATDLD